MIKTKADPRQTIDDRLKKKLKSDRSLRKSSGRKRIFAGVLLLVAIGFLLISFVVS